MASIVSGIIENINVSGTSHAIASTAYGICDTAASEPIKNVDITGFKLYEGVTIHVKFANANSASSPKLKFNSEKNTNAKPIVQYGTTAVGKTSETNGWYAGAVLTLTYDGTSWVRDQGYNTNTWNALSTSQAGYVSQAPNDTAKFLCGDANWSVLPTASTTTAGIIQIGTGATNAAAGNHNHNSTYLKLDGSNNMTADVNIIAGDTNKFINFWYNTGKAAGASWRTGMLGSGSGDTNYYVIESGTSTSSATTWNRVLQIGQNTYDAGFAGNIYPISTTSSKTLGTSSNKWATIYGTTFDGSVLKLHQGTAADPSLTGNARIEFDYSAGQPVVISYTPNDTYRNPAGLKIMGGTSASPAWFEVQGSIYADGGTNKGYRVPTTGSDTDSVGGMTTPVYVENGVITAGTALSDGAYKSILNNTSTGALGWNSGGNTNANNLRLINVNTLAYWNGAYSGTNSNLEYYKGGAFGTMAKETAADYATKAYVDGILAANDALVYKGTKAGASASTNGGTLMPAGVQGDTYKVSTAGYINGQYCEVGDMIICVTDVVASTTSNYTTTRASWNIIQTSDGTVSTSETSVTANTIPRYSGTTGKFIKKTEVSIDDNNNIYTPKILQTGRYFHNIINFSCNNTPKEILIKTKIPFTNGNQMPKIIIHMNNYTSSLPTELGLVFYVYNNAFTNYAITSNTKHRPVVTLSTYTENDQTYIAIGLGLIGTQEYTDAYYVRFNIDMLDIWASAHDYSKGWTIESNTTSTSIIPTNNRVTLDYVDQAQSAKCAAITSTQYGIAYYSDTTGTFASTGAGTSGQYLKSNGDSAPTWATLDTSGEWNGNAATATQLAASKTLWGQSFDGSGNITGDMTDVGPNFKLPSNASTDFYFLKSNNNAAAGYFGKLALNTTYANADLTNYVLDVLGAVRIKLPSSSNTNNRKFIITRGNDNLNLSISVGGIQAYNNITVSNLNLQYYGGNLQIGSSDYSSSATRDLYGQFNFKSSIGFNYSGMGAGSDNVARNIWFSYNGKRGIPVYDDDFKYNPSTNTLLIGTGTLTATSYSGNAATATAIETAGTTTQFYRGDNSWSNVIKQTAAAALGIDSNKKIGTAIKDLHFSLGSGSGTADNSGNAGGITFGTDTVSYGGVYWQTSGGYGSRLHFATTSSFANGAYTRMIITHVGNVGIGTLTPSTLLQVAGSSTLQHLYTQTDATYDIGATETRWRSAYLTTSLLVGAKSTITAYNSNALGSFVGPGVISSCVTAAGNGYYVMGQGIQYARMYISTLGKAGTATTFTNPDNSSQTVTGYTGNTTGAVYLMLGNDKAVGSNGTKYSSPGTAGTANNAQGYLRLYSSGSSYGEMTAYGSWAYPNTGLAIRENALGIMFRPDSSSYYTHISYQTNGNEALVAATTNAVTSFIFVNGEAQGNIASDRWTKLDGSGASGKGNAPGLQIKKNCVSIGKLIPSGTDPSYKLEVKGTTNLDGAVTVPHTAGASDGVRITYSTTIDFFMGIGTGNENHGLYDYKASKWILLAGSANTWTFDGNATSATKATNDSDGNAINTTYVKKVTSTDNAIARFDGTDGQIQNSTIKITDGGSLCVNPTTANSFNEGIRVNRANNGWAEIVLGGANDSASNTGSKIWLLGRRGSAGTYGAIGDFTIEENGSTGLGLTLHQSAGGATLYVSKANDFGLKIINAGTVAANTSFVPIRALTANMKAASYSIINIGQAMNNKNSAIFGFYYAGDASDNNYATIGLHSNNDLIKIFPTGKVNITKNVTSSSTTTGSLVVAGGTGIGGALYVGTGAYISGASTTLATDIFKISNSSDASWIPSGSFLAPSLTATHYNAIQIGVKSEDKNVGHLSFYFAGNKSTNNRLALGFYNVIDILVVRADRKVGINTTAPMHDLSINGETSSTKFIITDGASTPNDKVTLQWNSTDSSLDFVFT